MKSTLEQQIDETKEKLKELYEKSSMVFKEALRQLEEDMNREYGYY